MHLTPLLLAFLSTGTTLATKTLCCVATRRWHAFEPTDAEFADFKKWADYFCPGFLACDEIPSPPPTSLVAIDGANRVYKAICQNCPTHTEYNPNGSGDDSFYDMHWDCHDEPDLCKMT